MSLCNVCHTVIRLVIAMLAFVTESALADSTETYPQYSTELQIRSHGARLPALFYGAGGAGPHPTVVLLHGYPGNEKNLDIAQGLRAAGWNVLFFHYRGAWGAEGEFGFLNAEADVLSVIDFLQQADNTKDLRIDPNAISLVGHSMGGHMAIAGTQQDSSVRCAVAYDGANLGVIFSSEDKARERAWMAYGDTLFMLRGWSGQKALDEAAAQASKLNLLNHVAALGQRPILLVAADSPVIPLQRIVALKTAIETAGGNVRYSLIKDDHSFNNNRDTLLQITRDFLSANCR
jgi:dienelactone hydrolase